MRPIYAESGIIEFWIVNLVDECLEVYRDPQPDGTYQEVRVLKRGESTDIAALPGWSSPSTNCSDAHPRGWTLSVIRTLLAARYVLFSAVVVLVVALALWGRRVGYEQSIKSFFADDDPYMAGLSAGGRARSATTTSCSWSTTTPSC